jgi:hypothetical protein
MKTLQITLIILATSIITYAQESVTFLKDENVKGKVKSILSIYQGVKYQNEQWKHEYHFNSKGMLMKKVDYSKGNLTSTTEYIYDAKGFLLEEKCLDASGKITQKDLYSNDLKGNVIKQTTYYEGAQQPTYIKNITRNAAGKVLTETSKKFPENEIYYPKSIFKYDVKNNVIESYTEFGSGLFSKKTHQYTYNAKGKIEKEYINSVSPSMTGEGDDNISNTLVYKYDEKDRIIAIMDENGNVGNTYSFDAQGNLTKEDEKEFIYEYDQKGNWTKKTTITEGKNYCVEERTYVYSE